MPYPQIEPSSRQFTPGDYPIKAVRSQSGVETRILYGNRRTNMTMDLAYNNITDAEAELFTTHYDEVKGTFGTFTLGYPARAGWTGSAAALQAVGGTAWRYESPPSITAVKPGISNVQVKVVAVL